MLKRTPDMYRSAVEDAVATLATMAAAYKRLQRDHDGCVRAVAEKIMHDEPLSLEERIIAVQTLRLSMKRKHRAEKERNSLRDFYIMVAAGDANYAGFPLYRCDSKNGLPDEPTACSIVRLALERCGTHLEEKSVENIVQKEIAELRRYERKPVKTRKK